MPDGEDFEMAARDVAGEYDERTPPQQDRSRSPREAQASAQGALAGTGEASSSVPRPHPAPRALEPRPEALPKRRRTKKSAPETYAGAVFWAQEDAAVEVELDLPLPGKK